MPIPPDSSSPREPELARVACRLVQRPPLTHLGSAMAAQTSAADDINETVAALAALVVSESAEPTILPPVGAESPLIAADDDDADDATPAARPRAHSGSGGSDTDEQTGVVVKVGMVGDVRVGKTRCVAALAAPSQFRPPPPPPPPVSWSSTRRTASTRTTSRRWE